MSRGKYSLAYKHWPDGYEFKYNCYGQIPEPYDGTQEYDTATMFADHDEEGYDGYGYSAFDEHGNYVGIGNGVDREGWTEMEYLREEDINPHFCK